MKQYKTGQTNEIQFLLRVVLGLSQLIITSSSSIIHYINVFCLGTFASVYMENVLTSWAGNQQPRG